MTPEFTTRAHLEALRPSRNYGISDEVAIIALPFPDCVLETKVGPKVHTTALDVRTERNIIKISGFPTPDEYFVQARWVTPRGGPSSDWSVPLRFQVHPLGADLTVEHVHDHQLDLAVERHSDGSSTLVDVLSMPPNHPKDAPSLWFPTFVFEGCTPLFNETELYYRNPLSYLRTCLLHLIEKGAVFRTWSDGALENHSPKGLEIVLQFDVDGGPRSMTAVVDLLNSLEVRANFMIHRRGHHWYPYGSPDAGQGWLEVLSNMDSLVGYHNNALSQVLGRTHFQPRAEHLEAAERVFRQDIDDLRQMVDIPVFTHHGGNVVNAKMNVPPIRGLRGVDRSTSPELWRGLASMFSDGGFLSRPRCLLDHVQSLKSGRHFLRLHPFKYGNYGGEGDLADRRRVPAQRLQDCFAHEPEYDIKLSAHEQNWLDQRFAQRDYVRVNRTKYVRPISDMFEDQLGDSAIQTLRQSREPRFRGEYPWAGGDPRVFWWRMVRANTIDGGRYLNVGALPQSQKDQGKGFLPTNAEMEDLDIDSDRAPKITGDIVSVAHLFEKVFDGVFLFGLPYFEDPHSAVSASRLVVKPSGVGLFGFPATTHKTRGALWNPHSRPAWRREGSVLRSPSWATELWSFENPEESGLFTAWSAFDVEFHSHYWFVVARP